MQTRFKLLGLLFMLCFAAPACAQAAPGRPGCKEVVVNGRAEASPACLNESDYKVCEAEATRDLALEIERLRKMAVDFGPGGRSRGNKDPSTADSNYRYGTENAERLSKTSVSQYTLANYKVWDLKSTREFIRSWTEIVASLKSGDEDRMARAIGVPYRGRDLEMRLAGDERMLCLLKLRLAHLTGKPTTDKGGPTLFAAKDPFPKVGGGGPNEPVPAPPPINGSPGLGKGIMGAPLPKLTAAQISACSEEIRRTQLASQGWSGDVNQVAARLGRFQKDMFEGRCAGHPEAAAYIAGAEKMLSYTQGPSGVGTGGSPAGTVVTSLDGLSGGSSSWGSARPAPSPTTGSDSKQHNPANDALKCIAIYNENELKARGYKTIKSSMMVNTCPFSVSVQWCVEAGNGHRGDCKPGYANLWDLGANGTWGIDSQYQSVHYAACRKGPGMGFNPVELDPRNPYRFSCS
jgi:hypothetical protein